MTTEGASLAINNNTQLLSSLFNTQLLSSLFALFPTPVAIVDDHGRVIIANSAFNEVFQGISNVNGLCQHELNMPGRGIFELETVPLTDQGLKILYATDVTNEVQLRQQVVHLEKMAAIGRLVSGVAHELNNPLAGILGYAQLVSRGALDPPAQRMMEVILSQAERAGKIVQNFLSLAAKTEPKRTGFDLNATIRNLVQIREYSERLDDIIVTIDLDKNLPWATADESQIEQVLLNLIVNAEDAIADVQRRPGCIHIRTFCDAGRIHITVTDNGSGIHARDMVRIFDPFFTTKDKSHGTGLGLSICSEIIKDHGGELYAWSTYGNGSVFTLELPVSEIVEVEETKPAALSQGRSIQGKSVLVIDDEIHITELIYDVLSRYGANIDVVNSGTDALEQVQRKPYDIIVCDQRMPGLSGQRLYKLAENLNPDLRHRFLFVTGDVVNAQTKQFFQQTGVQFVRKPFRIQDLIDSIEILLNRNPPQSF